MKQARVMMTETIGGFVTVDFLVDETEDQLEERTNQQLSDMGIESFGDILKITHRDYDISIEEIIETTNQRINRLLGELTNESK